MSSPQNFLTIRASVFLRLIIPLIFATGSGCAQDSAAVREIGDNLFQIGAVRIDKQLKSVSFPVEVNMRGGPLEYLLVHESGKTHESLLSTKVRPSEVHVAMLLLGVHETKAAAVALPDHIDSAYLSKAPKVTGDAVDILVEWNENGTVHHARAEELVLKEGKRVKAGPWTYNGSAIRDGRFLADDDGLVVALVVDFAALINNPRPGNDDDRAWSGRSDKLPPEGTGANLTIRLLSKAPPKK
jgi:hypothetical protein